MVVDREVSHSIGDLAAMLDAERFVGRHRELAVVEAALAGDSPIRLVHIHGPAGIGKSALLRAAARLGRHAGRPLVVIDGRSDIADAQIGRAHV